MIFLHEDAIDFIVSFQYCLCVYVCDRDPCIVCACRLFHFSHIALAAGISTSIALSVVMIA